MVKDVVAALRVENDELRERVRQLGEHLASTKFVFPRDLGLTPTQIVLVRHLLTRDFITRQSAMTLLYSDRADDVRGANNVDVHISRIRQKLSPSGVQIENVWGTGWRILDRLAVAARFS